MQETYNRLRAELSALDAMLDKARTPAARERLAEKRKALKAEAHALLLAIHQQESAAAKEAQAALTAAKVLAQAAFTASMHGVVNDFLPRRLQLWLAAEAKRRKSGAKPYKPSKLRFLLVLIGAAR